MLNVTWRLDPVDGVDRKSAKSSGLKNHALVDQVNGVESIFPLVESID